MEDLKKSRGGLKRQLTGFKTYLTKCQDNEAGVDIFEITSRLEKTNLLWDRFADIQSKIELINDSEEQLKERDTFEDSFYASVAKAKQIISKLTPTAEPSSSRSITPIENQISFNQTNIKLPTLKLTEFSGDYKSFQEFHDTFDALINQNSCLSNVQRFYYLKSVLIGDAAQVIQNLKVSEANYNIAWDLLKERFDSKRLIINSHLKSILEMPNITRESAAALRNLLDSFQKDKRCLESLGVSVETWDLMLIFIMSSKLDPASKREWELLVKNGKLPRLSDFITFLKERCNVLENLNTKSSNNYYNKSFVHFANQDRNCPICKQSHSLKYCKTFLSWTPKARYNEAKKLNLCLNCLRENHNTADCRARSCLKCQKYHHTLLHFEFNTNFNKGVTHGAQSNDQNSLEIKQGGANDPRSFKPNTVLNAADCVSVEDFEKTNCAYSNSNSIILLSTALCYILDKYGNPVKCRCLLDNGSQSNFMTTELFKKLNLNCININIPIMGINQNHTNITLKTSSVIKSMYNEYSESLDFLVMNTITGNIPSYTIKNISVKTPNHIKLADPQFYKSQSIDILLGAAVFWNLLCNGHIRLGPNKPILQNTLLGYIISGPLPLIHKVSSDESCLVSIDDRIEQFWKIEEFPNKQFLTKQETFCENHFLETHSQTSSGRFIVNFPLNEDPSCLGYSFNTALKRFYSLENKFKNNIDFKNTYTNFINEYLSLGHMSEIPESEINTKNCYYLPHHGVFKNSSLTTKLRVVFDGSCKTTTNISLNDILAVGPKIQDDIFSILLRFRKHNFVFIADVEKMYRQVLINKSQRALQRIVWRETPNARLRHFELNTVTYGTASASFLAIRCLHQAAINNRNSFSDACSVILSDFYVDDLITGSNSIQVAKQLKSDITKVLFSSGFQLRKFMSNDKSLISDSEKSDASFYSISDDTSVKTLGILWDSLNDKLKFTVKDYDNSKITKRLILSKVSQIFDPLGLVGPIIIRAKLILQALWKSGVSWDDEVPNNIKIAFVDFQYDCMELNHFQLPRQAFCPNIKNLQIHGFCDASERAYGACIYIRIIDTSDKVHVNLLCAKSKVAPLKIISLPRLELCAFLLLSRLMNQVLDSLKIEVPNSNIFYWSDSNIVLSWLASEPSSWKTFVANRISEIQSIAKSNNFKHVSSVDNPADIISRGSNTKDLFESSIWFNGPNWLKYNQDEWPMLKVSELNDLPESRNNLTLIANNLPSEFSFIEKFSRFSTLRHVTAYCLRFIQNLKNPKSKILGALTAVEISNATNSLILIAQSQSYSSEINILKNNKVLKGSSSILSLNPFIDEYGVLRVGGRLRNSKIPYAQKHQALLASSHPLTKLIIRYEHERLLHAGILSVLASIRLRYWIINGRSAVGGIIRKCITCFRAKPHSNTPIMGNLPERRVNPSRPFLTCAMDYAGPFNIKDGVTRSRKIIKVYICLFICFTTKATHLELAGDLTTESFLNCLKRFTSRRGLCKDIFCDNATNFVGAKNTLEKIYAVLKTTQISNYLRENQISWHFIPPRSPHFGGLHERAVASCKHHLVRILADKNLNFESFYTILTQVEAILNSRPLSPLSTDPNDLNPLTPSHFLIGTELIAIPEGDVTEIPTNRLTKFQQMQQCIQDFWKRWKNEYLCTLQVRSKWKKSEGKGLEPGIMVLIKEDNVPPMKWTLGRIKEVFPGQDGVVRVADVQTKNGLLRRSWAKLSILPIDDESDNQ